MNCLGARLLVFTKARSVFLLLTSNYVNDAFVPKFVGHPPLTCH